ncbi:MAG: LpxI family protein, partial [Thermoguttaceae bacterium]
MSLCRERPSRVGLLAGWGRYPVYLAEALKQEGIQVFCLGVVNHADPALKKICDDWSPLGLGRMQSAFRFFNKHNLTYGMMAGKINKRLILDPWLIWQQLPDFYTMKTFFPMLLARRKDCKDDTLLMAVVEAFAEKGFHLLPGTDLVPELLVKRKKLTRRGPSSSEWKDVCFGWTLAKEMGRLDVGQSVCVKNQAALAVEAIEGTDECIRRAGSL